MIRIAVLINRDIDILIAINIDIYEAVSILWYLLNKVVVFIRTIFAIEIVTEPIDDIP